MSSVRSRVAYPDEVQAAMDQQNVAPGDRRADGVMKQRAFVIIGLALASWGLLTGFSFLVYHLWS